MDTVEHDGVFGREIDELSMVRWGERTCGVKDRIKKVDEILVLHR